MAGENKRALLKCVCCGRLIYKGDPVWEVQRALIINEQDLISSPCCSEECAKKARVENLKLIHQRKARLRELFEAVCGFKPEEMLAEDFLPKKEEKK